MVVSVSGPGAPCEFHAHEGCGLDTERELVAYHDGESCLPHCASPMDDVTVSSGHLIITCWASIRLIYLGHKTARVNDKPLQIAQWDYIIL